MSGYERVVKIDHSLQYAIRGGVIDIFSVNYNDPIRIEFNEITKNAINKGLEYVKNDFSNFTLTDGVIKFDNEVNAYDNV